MSEALFLGIDIGTTGIRISVIDAEASEVASVETDMIAPTRDGHHSRQDSQHWIRSLQRCLKDISSMTELDRVAAIAVDATSSSILLTLDDGTPLTAATMYDDSSAQQQADRIAGVAPDASGAHGANSSLAKLMHLRDEFPSLAAQRVCHQADFINGWLCERYDISDENNCLKLGYDVIERRWPSWFEQLDVPSELLPEVVPPGTPIARLCEEVQQHYGFNRDCMVVSGTTDSIAAFIATGADKPGDAVTSLGSTLVVKLLSDKPLFASEYGVYSHRYHAGDKLWLVGGASNAGCKLLSEQFSQQQMDEMSTRLNPEQDTGLHYVPLPAGSKGERFPTIDSELQQLIEPRPDDDTIFFQGLLESIADIEARAYARLQQLGCAAPSRILTAGGGSRNQAWNRIRERRLHIPVTTAANTEACYGAALLARQAMN